MDKTYYAFPEANTIMNCNIEEIKALGFSQRKSEALINMASVIALHKGAYSNLEKKPDKNVVELLSNLKGVGRWSIEYAMLRGLGRIGVLPGDDVGFQKSLKNFLKIGENLDYNQVKEIEAKWSPYGGLIYFHLLLQKLYEKRLILLNSLIGYVFSG